mmetsp:Transcript_7117/g.26061  ORF Transcript_7117/g.26061 Transcript_7117/m.26061 type:complete len:117 (+) Transcript_7117:743-1093(+)
MLETESAPLFSHFLLGSPSIGWDGGAFVRLEEQTRSSRPVLSASVLMVVGSQEGPGTLRNAKEFEKAMHQAGVRVTVDIVQGETHGSVSFPFAGRAIAWLADELSKSRAGAVASGA